MFSLDTTPWKQWLEHTKEAVKQMDMLMESKYAVTIREVTTPLVPLKTGKLIGSFITDLSSTFPVTEMTFGYSVFQKTVQYLLSVSRGDLFYAGKRFPAVLLRLCSCVTQGRGKGKKLMYHNRRFLQYPMVENERVL